MNNFLDTSSTPSTQRIAVRAAIMHEGTLLFIREAATYAGGSIHGLYDLPGGKINVGETLEAGIRREVREETGLDVEIRDPFYVGEWRPTVNGETLQIIAIFFLCSATSTDVHLSRDHDDYKWLALDETSELPIADPIPEALQVLKGRNLF